MIPPPTVQMSFASELHNKLLRSLDLGLALRRDGRRFYMRLTICPFVIFSLTGCWSEEIRFEDLVTEWRTREGFSISINKDSTYRFCDQDNCFTGRYRRPGASTSIALHLEGLLQHPEARRLASQVERWEGRGMIYPDLDFTPTGGSDPPSWCKGKPCVLIGLFERDDHIIFFRTQDLE